MDITAEEIFHYTHHAGYLLRWSPLGHWVSRLGSTASILASPCDVTPWMWVNAAWVAAPRLIYLKSKPFLQAEEAYRFLDTRCGGRRGIVKNLAAALDIQAPQAPPDPKFLGKAAWAGFKIAADFALKAEWYFMIADRATEFTYNWVSLAYTWNGCTAPGDEWAGGTMPAGTSLLGVDATITQWIVDGFTNHINMNDTFISTSQGWAVTLMYDLTIQADPSGDPPAGFQIFLIGNNGAIQGPTNSYALPDGSQHANGVMYYDGSPTFINEYRIYVQWTSEGSHQVGGASFRGYGFYAGKKGLLFDP